MQELQAVEPVVQIINKHGDRRLRSDLLLLLPMFVFLLVSETASDMEACSSSYLVERSVVYLAVLADVDLVRSCRRHGIRSAVAATESIDSLSMLENLSTGAVPFFTFLDGAGPSAAVSSSSSFSPSLPPSSASLTSSRVRLPFDFGFALLGGFFALAGLLFAAAFAAAARLGGMEERNEGKLRDRPISFRLTPARPC